MYLPALPCICQSLGVSVPAAQAMDPHGPVAGNSARPMVLGMGACALAALLTTWATLGRHGAAAANNLKESA